MLYEQNIIIHVYGLVFTRDGQHRSVVRCLPNGAGSIGTVSLGMAQRMDATSNSSLSQRHSNRVTPGRPTVFLEVRPAPREKNQRAGMPVAPNGEDAQRGVRQEAGRLTSRFLDLTTIHGLGHLQSGHSCGWRLLWALLVVCSAGTLVVCVLQITHMSLVERRSTSTVQRVMPASLAVPAVTVCGGHFFSQPRAERLGVSPELAAYISTTSNGLMGDSEPRVAAQLKLKLLEAELQQLLRRSGLTLQQLFDQLSPSCEETVTACWLGRWTPLNSSECCSRLLRAVYTPLGRCWTSLGTSVRQSMAGARFGLHLKLQPMDEPAVMNLTVLPIELDTNGQLQVVATNHYTPPAFPVMNHAIAAGVGQALKLEVWKEEHDITAERRPLLGGPTTCQTVPMSAGGPLSTAVAGTASCMVHAVRQLYLDHCGCRHLGLDVLERTVAREEATPLCSPLQTLTCAASQVQRLFANASRGLLLCQSACVADSIRVTVTYEQRPAEEANTTTVTVFYPELAYTLVTSAVPEFMDWFQGVGGVAGLFLGMSILSFAELLMFLTAVVGQLLRLLFGALCFNRPVQQRHHQHK